MIETGLQHSDRLSRAGLFTQVQKGRTYMKPVLGDYRHGNRSPGHYYWRPDIRTRIESHSPVLGDIESLKSAGYVMANAEEVMFNHSMIHHPWHSPCESKQETKKKKQETPAQPPAKKIYRGAPEMIGRKLEETPDEKMKREVESEFRRCLDRIGKPAVLGQYMRTNGPRSSRFTINTVALCSDNPEDERILKEAKRLSRMFRRKSTFKARKVPWDKLMRPGKFEEVTTVTHSFAFSEDGELLLKAFGPMW